MGSLGAILKHPDDVYPLMKLKMAMRHAEKQIPPEPHWAFCYTMLHKVSRSFGLVIQQLGTDLRNAVCIFYLVLRALDTVEDDTSIATEIKVPILKAFHRHIYDRDWHFSCGTKEYKVLMDEFHHVSTAFLELGRNYQEAIEDITMRMGAGMAKFICKEVETIDDYDEYCHYVAGLVGLGLSKLFHASGTEDLASDFISNSMGLFLQKTNIIRDYLEDINEIPKSRMFWPRQIWSKYVNKLEDLKNEENSVKAVQCLNDMVTNALIHMEDCLTYMAALRDPAIFRFCAIPQIMAIGTLALCYNNVEVFRGVVKMRRGLTAKIIERTKTMSDVYGAFFDFSCMLKSKVDKNDPNATKTLSRIDAIQKTCRESGTLTRRKSYIISKPRYNSALIFVLLIILAILFAYLTANRPANMWEPFINGQAIPYDPKYHQEWVRNKRHDRPCKVERPRNFDRRQNRDFQMNNHDVQNPSGSNLSGAPAYMPSPPNIAAPPPPPPPPPPPLSHNMGGQPNITGMPQNNMGGGMPQNNMGGGMPQNNMGGGPPQHMGGGQPQCNAGGGMPQNNMGGNPQYNMGRMPQNNMGGPPNNWGGGVPPNMGGEARNTAPNFQYGPNNGGMPYQNREMPGPGQNREYQPNNFVPNSGGGNPYQALDMPGRDMLGRDMPPPPNYQ